MRYRHAARQLRFRGVGVEKAQDHDDKDERGSHQQAGNDPGDEHIADADLRQNAVDHEEHRRRNDRRHQPARRGHGGGEVPVIATLDHLGHHHMAHHRDLRVGRANDGGHEHVGDKVDVGQPAAQRPDKDAGKFDQTLGDAALVHQLAHQHEERDRQQPVFLQPAIQLLRIGQEQHVVAAGPDVDHRGDRQHQRDGHAGKQQQAEGKRNHYATSLSDPSGPVSGPP